MAAVATDRMEIDVNVPNLGLFVLSALALLGSPGPGIAALLAICKTEGLASGLRYFGGLLLGLSIAAATTAGGLLSAVTAVPVLAQLLSWLAALYLVWLAWKIASSPVGDATPDRRVTSTFFSGAVLGLSNPKAYPAFASLFAMPAIVPASHVEDALVKWFATVLVIVFVDLVWLGLGVRLRQFNLSPRRERALNISLGLLVLATVALMSLPHGLRAA